MFCGLTNGDYSIIIVTRRVGNGNDLTVQQSEREESWFIVQVSEKQVHPGNAYFKTKWSLQLTLDT